MSASLSAGEYLAAAPTAAPTHPTFKLQAQTVTPVSSSTLRNVFAVTGRLTATIAMFVSGAALTNMVMTYRADLKILMWVVAPVAAALLAFMLVTAFTKSKTYWVAAATVVLMILGMSMATTFVPIETPFSGSGDAAATSQLLTSAAAANR